jgi:hypothetical protein
MSGSSLKSFLLPAALLSSTVFATLTLPLALLGSKPIDIRMQSEPVFSGQIRDIAAPYLGFAAALSLGVGTASIAVTGWKRSLRKSSQMEETLSSVQEDLQLKEKQLEALKLSESQLAASGLTTFLQGEVVLQEPTLVDAVPAIAPTEATLEPLTVSSDSLQSAPSQPVNVQAAVSALSPAQAFFSFAQVASASEAPTAEDPVSQFDALQTQLKQMMAQIEMLQGALQSPPVAAVQTHEAVKVRYGNQRLHTIEALPVQQKVAS